MKNPVKKSKDKIIEALFTKEIKTCCPDGNIPNSRVAKQIELARANAALQYAKTLNRRIRRAKMGECQFNLEKKENKVTITISLYKDAKAAAKYLYISMYRLNKLKEEGQIESVHFNNKAHYLIEDLDRLSNTNPFFVSK